jgi:transcriptional regulator with XRE-family HTH domain
MSEIQNKKDKTIGQTLQMLREANRPGKLLTNLLGISGSTYSKIERGEKELSLNVAVKLVDFYDLSLDELISMIDPAEFKRKELSSIKWARKMHERQKQQP